MFAGKGRSGYVAKIGAGYLSDTGKQVSFFNAPSSPRAKKFSEKNITLITVSGSGETAEVVQAAKDYKNLDTTIVTITASPESSLGDFSDFIVQVARGKGTQRGGSYLGRQIVRPESPTMGDESEEMSLLTLYLLTKKLRNPTLDVEKEAKNEIEKFKTILKENRDSYVQIREAIDAYRNAGIYFVGMGKSETVSHMVSNRAHHYGFEVYATGNSVNPPIKFHNLAVIVSGSGSAGGLLSNIIRKGKEASTKVGNRKNRIGVACVIGKQEGIEKEGDISLYLHGARSCGIPTVDQTGKPEPFYFRAPVTFNMMLREIAEERGITLQLARERHVNI